MRIVAFAFTLAALSLIPAMAEDTAAQSCTAYLPGNWAMQKTLKAPGDDATIIGAALATVTFVADGTYTSTSEVSAEGNPATTVQQHAGTWSASDGPGEKECALTFKPKTASSYSESWTISGPDEMIDSDGDRAKRTP